MTGDPKLDAVLAFLVSPFPLTLLALIAAAVWLAVQEERTDYLAPWADREPGDLS